MPTVLGSFYKKTSDDWHPSFCIRTKVHVEAEKAVQIRMYRLDSGVYRITARGGDDTLMELDTEVGHRFDAVVLELLRMESVSMNALERLGFAFQ